jgi:hypothetical protein
MPSFWRRECVRLNHGFAVCHGSSADEEKRQDQDVGGERNRKPAGHASRGLCCEFLSPESERHFAVRTFTLSLKRYPRAGRYRPSNAEDCLISMFLFGNKTLKAGHSEKIGARFSQGAIERPRPSRAESPEQEAECQRELRRRLPRP